MRIQNQSTNDSYLRQGQLFPYASQPAVYRCPADLSQTGGRLHVRSYSMNSWMGSRYMETYSTPATNPAGKYRTFVKENEFASAGLATLWVIADEHEATIDDAWFLVTMDNSQPFASLPAFRHQLGYTLNFADGHVELFKMRDPNTSKALERGQINPQNSDWLRLRQVTTVE
jgi:prepilin-type processing-associated H-X9-DG protein